MSDNQEAEMYSRACEKLQQELESVKADKENLRQHLLSECRNHKATQDEFENLQREMIQVKHIHNANCDELAAEKAKAKELLEALEFYGDVNSWETTKIDKTPENPIYLYRLGIINDMEKFITHMIGGKIARHAIAKYKGASDGK